MRVSRIMLNRSSSKISRFVASVEIYDTPGP